MVIETSADSGVKKKSILCQSLSILQIPAYDWEEGRYRFYL